jgi:hypothetical protein
MSLDFTKEYDSKGFSVMPCGTYTATVEKAEYKASKKDGTEYLSLMFRFDNNRVVFNIYNIFNKNDTARNVAMGELKQLLIAQGTDVAKLASVTKESLVQLLTNGGKIDVEVGIREDSFGEKNTIKKVTKSTAVAPVVTVKKDEIPF